jgi:DNA-binding IclR family transcriptional regulator
MQFMNKIVTILNTLNSEETNVGVVELSRKTDMPTTTVYRILNGIDSSTVWWRGTRTPKSMPWGGRF